MGSTPTSGTILKDRMTASDRVEVFRQALEKDFDAYGDEWINSQIQRFYDTIYFADDYLPNFVKAVDLGRSFDGDPFIKCLAIAYPEIDIDRYEGDLLMPLRIQDDYYDGVICTEVIEHFSDQKESGDPCDGYYYHSAYSLLSEINRILKKGGMLLLTTCNASSITAIGNAIEDRPPFVWHQHVREFGPQQLINMLLERDFSICRLDTYDSLTSEVSLHTERTVKEAIIRAGQDLTFRGNVIMVVAQK